ncbi:MAG: zinc ribbon domain-containing protein [Methanomassiliicoccaceae archaeon]|jgi:uncharacterized OB-fold protein|nr:zinc ribbon domain-containing protein [Methanomassiliicoccaceae archaeon]
MNGYQKTGFQAFRETKAAPPLGIVLALSLSLFLVWIGFYAGMLDGLVIAIFAFIILRLFKASKRLGYMLTFAAILWILVSLIMFSRWEEGDLARSLYITAVIIVLPFLLLTLLTWWMRKNLEKTRARLEREGRLYPQGYGRCRRCGSMVLPGETACRKCGEYIDVPEEMRVKKVNFFECSECGREVPPDAGVCPYCGEAFEEDAEKK